MTIVAAWTSADTGVGPAIASGSHTNSGPWADLPKAPSISSTGIQVFTASDEPSGPDAEQRTASRVQHAGLIQGSALAVQRERPVLLVDQKQRQDQAEVADPVDDERLLRGVHRHLGRAVVADEQVAAQAHALPAEEQQHEVVGHHQRRHREDEQRDPGEEAGVARIPLHVAHGVDGDQRADAGDDEEHHAGEVVDRVGEAHRQVAALEPGPQRGEARAALGQACRAQQREDEAQQHRPGADPPGQRLAAAGPVCEIVAAAAAPEREEGAAHRRGEGDPGDGGDEARHAGGSGRVGRKEERDKTGRASGVRLSRAAASTPRRRASACGGTAGPRGPGRGPLPRRRWSGRRS